MGASEKLGVPSWRPHNKDCTIWGSILGSPYSGKLPYSCLVPAKKCMVSALPFFLSKSSCLRNFRKGALSLRFVLDAPHMGLLDIQV